MAFVDDEDLLSNSSRRRVPIMRSQVAFAWGAWGGLVIPDPDTVRSEHRVERSGEPTIPVPEQKLDRGSAAGKVHQQVAGGLGTRPDQATLTLRIIHTTTGVVCTRRPPSDRSSSTTVLTTTAATPPG
jgi:hypothetical protein